MIIQVFAEEGEHQFGTWWVMAENVLRLPWRSATVGDPFRPLNCHNDADPGFGDFFILNQVHISGPDQNNITTYLVEQGHGMYG